MRVTLDLDLDMICQIGVLSTVCVIVFCMRVSVLLLCLRISVCLLSAFICTSVCLCATVTLHVEC